MGGWQGEDQGPQAGRGRAGRGKAARRGSGRPRQGEGGFGAVGTDQEDGSGQGLSSMIRSQ